MKIALFTITMTLLVAIVAHGAINDYRKKRLFVACWGMACAAGLEAILIAAVVSGTLSK